MKNLHDMNEQDLDEFLARSAKSAGLVQNVSLGVLMGLDAGFACGLFGLVFWFGGLAGFSILVWLIARRHARQVAEREEKKGKP